MTINPGAAAAHLTAERLRAGAARILQQGDRARQTRKASASVWAALGNRALEATVRPSFRADEAIAETLATASAALHASDVPHVQVDSYPELPQIQIQPRHWNAALRALAADPKQHWYALRGGRIRRVTHRLEADATGTLRLFRAWADPEGRFLAGPDVGFSLSRLGKHSVVSAEPVDVVYTWVDGADPEWQRQKEKHTPGANGELHETATNQARFTSIEELRFSLRSLVRYAPWVRNVYVVTASQVPRWMADEHPSVKIIDHTEIFDDADALPTFNSHAIESRLHHIDGLAERYLYLNDDVFFAQYLPPSTFFDENGHPRVFLSGLRVSGDPRTRLDAPVVAAAKNNRDLLLRLTGKPLTHRQKHVPHPQLRSVAFELEARAPDEFAHTGRAKFREPTDLSIASSLLPFYCYLTGRGSLGTIGHFYADVASAELSWRLPRLLRERDTDIICLNATTHSQHHYAAMIRAFYEAYFPGTSPFERPEAP